jgi:hypothetical protein
MPLRSRPHMTLALVAILAATACGSGAERSSSAAQDGWHDFSGTWNAAGSRRMVDLGQERHASLLDLKGTLLLQGDARPAVGFRADSLFLADTTTGLVGRAAWTDENGDHVYSELTSAPPDTLAVTGTIVGGTGRYSGATGAYTFTWSDVLATEEGAIQGRATNLTGRIRTGSGSAS